MLKNTFTLILAICVVCFFFACQKEDPNPINPCVQLTNTQILAQKDWQIDEVWRSQGGVNSHYLRGGENTTGTNYGNLRFHFNADGTGTYIDEVGTNHTINWSFTSADERNLSLNIGPPFPVMFVWNMLELKNNYMHSTTPYSGNNLLSARYIQIP